MADLRTTARTLRDLVEPIAAGVYFAPEAHQRYEALGLAGFGPGYFCSRGACLGTAPWTVIGAAFGVFNPAIVEPSVTAGWAVTTHEPMLAAREAGATDQLQRLLGDPDDDVKRATDLLLELTDGIDGAGRMLFSGLRALPIPNTPWGALWRAADLVREHRGDGHIAAWIPHVDAVEINLLGELWWRMPLQSYSRTRGWSDEDLQAALDRLRTRGLIKDEGFTPDGEKLRARIEDDTDTSAREVIDRLGSRAPDLFALLEPWAKAIVAGGGYPRDPSELTRK
jgi:hypothetical protein